MMFTLVYVLSDDLNSYMYHTVDHDDVTLMFVLSCKLDIYVYQTVIHDVVHFDVCFVR